MDFLDDDFPMDEVIDLVPLDACDIIDSKSTNHSQVFFLDENGKILVLKITDDEYASYLQNESNVYAALLKSRVPCPQLYGSSAHCLLVEFVPPVRKYDATFFLDAARELHAVHQAGYLHCDVKEQNFLAKRIFDFGLSQSHSNHRICRGSTPVRTAPELFDGAYPTIESDVYSFGCMIAACQGFEISRTGIAEPFFARERLPSHNDLVRRCTLTDPSKRVSMDEIIEYFKKI